MKEKLNFILKLGVFVLLLVSILPSIFSNYWFIDIFSSFKIQIVLFLLFLFILNMFLKKSKVVGVILILLIIWNASFITSLYFPSRFGEISKGKGTSIASINLLSSNNEFEKVRAFIKDKNPDVLILLEYNSTWDHELSPITNNYSFKKTVVREDNFGIAYFSNIDSKVAVLNFDDTNIPSIRADLKIRKTPMTILATHPLPPMGQIRFDSRNIHLKNIAKKRNEFSNILIVVGDLNTSSYSKHFQHFLSETDLKDSRNGFGILATWPANYKIFQTTLDHFLVSENIHVMKRTAGSTIGSDHLPIQMEFSIIK